jgi:hypothetical protein
MEITKEEIREAEEWFGINLTKNQIQSLDNADNASNRTKGALKKKGLVELGPDGLRVSHFGMEVCGFFR